MTKGELAAALAHRQAGRIAEAERMCRLHLAETPGDVQALHELGLTMIARAKASEAHRKSFAPALTDLATDLSNLGAVEPAIEIYRAAIAFDNGHAMAHMGLGMALLSIGRLGEGWPEYEWHRRMPGYAPARFAAPLWDGRIRPGLRILLHAEQGFGDALQFVRYATALKAATGAEIILGCAPALKRLLSRVEGVDSVIGHGEAIPAHDCHLPLLSLPGLMKTELDSIPGPVGYVSPEPADVETRRIQLAGLAVPRVGLIWQGNQKNPVLRQRSIALGQLLPILHQPGVSFVSLQPEAGSVGPPDIAPGMRSFEPFAEMPPHDFADTAAVMANLDLVISIDTAGAHLAGALGRPVWTLLTRAADWRWLRGRADSPWYPTMRLFRQQSAGDWDEVMARVAIALRDWIDGNRR